MRPDANDERPILTVNLPDAGAATVENAATGRFDPLARRFYVIVVSIFVLSGAAGLVYEVVWSRLLTVHVFGTTIYAVSTVLAAFMGGMALGAYWIGRRADASGHPLRFYAVLEFGIGLYALLFPLLLKALVWLFVLLARDKDPNIGLAFARFTLAFAVLLVPTTLMGATLPAVTRYLSRPNGHVGRDVGILYAANTFGAVAGTLLAGFLLIRVLGVTGTLVAAAVANFAIGAAAWVLSRRPVVPSLDAEEEPLEPEGEAAPPDPRLVRASVAAFGISGFCALAYEVLWTRILVFFLGSTTYAFATMLAAFLTGIAIGSVVFARVADRVRRVALALGTVQAALGIAAAASLPLFSELYPIVRWIGVGGRVTVFFVLVGVMLLPTFLMGATFPLVARIAVARRSRFAQAVGGIYAVNTLGAILGSLAAGFVIIPLVGIRDGVLLMALLNIGAAAWVFVADRETQRWERILPTAFGIGVVAIAFVLFPRTQFILKSAIYQEQFARQGEKARVLAYEEGPDASVTVLQDPDGIKRLYVDTNEAANDGRWDAPSHRVIAHVPLLLHPNPKRALVVGFGMGRTSNSIIQHGVEVDAVEISPEVPQMARRFFAEANGNVLASPELNLHINDGRNFILTTRKRYDMISTGIIHPLVSAGSSSIYSRDFYELAKAILTDDGVMSQWVPTHRLPLEDLKVIIRTFLSVFPNTTVWFKYSPDFLVLVGTKHEQTIDFQEWYRRTRLPRVDADLAKDDLDTWSLLDSYFMGPEAARRFVGDGPLHTDDHPYLEFFGTGLGGMMTTQVQNMRALMPFRESVFPLLRNFAGPQERGLVKTRLERYFAATQDLLEGEAQFAAQRYDAAIAAYHKAQRRNPDDPTIAYHMQFTTDLVRSGLDTQISALARPLLARVRANPRDLEALTNLGLVYRNGGQLDEAISAFERAKSLDPDRIQPYLLLGETYERNGQIDKAIGAYEYAAKLAPDQIVIYGSLSVLYDQAGRIEDAIRAAKKVLALQPGHALAYSQLGSLYAEQGDLKSASEAYRKAIDAKPEAGVLRDAWHGLGVVQAEAGSYDDAAESFRAALQIDPNFIEAREHLRQVEQFLTANGPG